jgi:hypothetical protein
MILIGSQAIKFHYPSFPREPKDFDFAVKIPGQATTIGGKRVEFLENPVLCETIERGVASPDVLVTLKASHLCWDINWSKHMWDTQWLLERGHKIVPDLFWKLYTQWENIHGKNKRSDLTLSKEDFFDNALTKYDHDTLHTYLNPIPTYLSMLSDGRDVEICPLKFEAASHEDKVKLVKEEVSVMAFERFKLPYKHAYDRMLKKYIMGHVPKFALIWAIENFHAIRTPDCDFMEILDEANRVHTRFATN